MFKLHTETTACVMVGLLNVHITSHVLLWFCCQKPVPAPQHWPMGRGRIMMKKISASILNKLLHASFFIFEVNMGTVVMRSANFFSMIVDKMKVFIHEKDLRIPTFILHLIIQEIQWIRPAFLYSSETIERISTFTVQSQQHNETVLRNQRLPILLDK